MKILHVSRVLPQEMLGPMYLSRAVKDAGHQMRALFLPDPRWLEKFREYAPDVVTWSVMTGTHQQIAAVNRFLKSKFEFFSVMGGPHPTFVPKMVLDPAIDAICIGEGEGAIVDLVTALERGQDWHAIPNLAYAGEDGQVVQNPVRPLVKDLDALGFPDRALVYDANAMYRKNPRKVFLTQRGCPMQCSFCFHHAWRRKVYAARVSQYVRKRSVDHVIAEVNATRAKYPLEFVHFLDDIFNIDNDWLAEFSARWPLEVGLPFDVILMANMTREKHIAQLKHAGCVYARIAFEAANDTIRNEIYRKGTTKDQLRNAARWIKAHGIRLGSLNMLGSPGGTLADDLDTVRLNIECEVDHPLCSIVQPYPEFDLNEITENMGYAVEHYDDFPAQFNRKATIRIDNKRAIENLHKWFPILVRHPKWMPFAERTLNSRFSAKPLLIAYALYSEWLVTEQNRLYRRSSGLRSLANWAPLDFSRRVLSKTFVRTLGLVGGGVVQRLAARLEFQDERAIAHID